MKRQIEDDIFEIHSELLRHRLTHFDTNFCNWGINSQGKAVLLDVESSVCSEKNYSILTNYINFYFVEMYDQSFLLPLTLQSNRLGVEASHHVLCTWRNLTHKPPSKSYYLDYLKFLQNVSNLPQFKFVNQKIITLLALLLQQGHLPPSLYDTDLDIDNNLFPFPFFSKKSIEQRNLFAVLQYFYLFFPFQTQEALNFISAINIIIDQLDLPFYQKEILYLDPTFMWKNDNLPSLALLPSPLKYMQDNITSKISTYS